MKKRCQKKNGGRVSKSGKRANETQRLSIKNKKKRQKKRNGT
jgi:hypothetical protein